MDCSLPGSSVHGIFQARVLEQVALFHLQGIFLTQGLNLGLLHWMQMLYCLSHQGISSLVTEKMINLSRQKRRQGNQKKSIDIILKQGKRTWIKREALRTDRTDIRDFENVGFIWFINNLEMGQFLREREECILRECFADRNPYLSMLSVKKHILYWEFSGKQMWEKESKSKKRK